MAFSHTSIQRGRWARFCGGGVALLLALALAATAAMPAASATEQPKQLTFEAAPNDWSVVSGEPVDKLGRVKASGVHKRRIRYSIDGTGFAIHKKKGIVSYDGTALGAGEALLTVTARDKGNKAAEATLSIRVTVTVPEETDQITNEVTQPEPEVAQQEIQLPAKPAGFKAEPGNTGVLLSWTDPCDTKITGYEISRRSRRSKEPPVWWPFGNWDRRTPDDTDLPACSGRVWYWQGGLTNGDEYGFKVRALWQQRRAGVRAAVRNHR